MTSPNVQIQNLMRRYVRERDGITSFDSMMQSLISPSEIHDTFGGAGYNILNTPINMTTDHNELILPNNLQTSLLYNFRSTSEYKILDIFPLLDMPTNADNTKDNSTNDDNIFEMDFGEPPNQTILQKDTDIYVEEKSDYKQFFGSSGVMNNVFGAELVDVKWMLYGFIVSKIHKSFKTNMLNDCIRINSLHLGADSGSVQAALNHLFYASTQFAGNTVQWKWATISRSNELYSSHKSSFIPLLSVRPYWEQAIFIINKTCEIADRFNLIIHQMTPDEVPAHIRASYLFTIIMALKFSDSHSILLIELPMECEWDLLEINILALCGLIYDAVYLTKYEIGRNYCVLICRDRKKNLNTSMLIKKLLKILTESNTLCIVDKQALTPVWLAHIENMIKSPMLPIRFTQIVESIKNNLFYNEYPLSNQ